ncbi:LamG-like jellyroll fold domain-containing protein [Spirosoma validum]|uniref:DUF5018 domain-containing protein n=1 Tax=Spirosoma validum TaxID=2771355 RepID=A0A927B2H2_9BACT|nr:LamG-like jellyroll fold domain-containing protein [Spirosoma validum]MBD2754032.1 DUF5018 domain-containing protein [Spirosoma validum]
MKLVSRATSGLLLLLCLVFVRCSVTPNTPQLPKSSTKTFTDPIVDGLSGASSMYDASTFTYTVTVPFGTDVTALKLSFIFPTKATAKPTSGSVQNFTNPILYTITAEDGSAQTYTVKMVVAGPPKSSEKQITDFRFATLSPVVSATVDQTTRKIAAIVPGSTSLTTLVPTIAFSAKATVSPTSGQVQNFTNPVIYTVTAEDGSTQTYEVAVKAEVKVDPPVSNSVIAYFSFDQNDCRNDNGPESGGTLKGNASFANGVKGRCLLLDGSGDYAELGRGYRLSNSFAITGWINPDEVNRMYASIFAKYETVNYGPYDFYLNTNHAAFWISDGLGLNREVLSKGTVKANQWTHVVWVADNRKIRIYINGVLDNEEAIIAMTSNNDLVTIGRNAFVPLLGAASDFKGKIDELRIFNRALTTAEVQQLYASEKP